MPILDIFKTTDAFSMRSLTDAVLKMPYAPGVIRSLGLFEPRPVMTTTIVVEEKDGQLKLIPTSPRGGVAPQYTPNKRTARPFELRHIEQEDQVNADEVLNVRRFGAEMELEAISDLVTQRMEDLNRNLDVTEEHLMCGALKGTIVEPSGTTILSLFTEFGVSQETEVAFDLTAASPASGAVARKCNGIIRKIQDNLGATPMTGVQALCSPEFFDDFVANVEVRASWDRFRESEFFRRANVVPGDPTRSGAGFPWGGIMWQEYRGTAGATTFITADKAIFFPIGVPGLYRWYYGPIDRIVGGEGMRVYPRYGAQYVDPEGRFVKLHIQSNPLPLCLRPKVLMLGKRGA